jgi:endoglucanase
MWDLPPFELRDDCLYSRACDDLVGCACILAALRALAESGAEASVLAAFTVAEEVGLLGAAYLANSGELDPRVPIISLETSAERPPARMHGGVIVRVGDRTSVFDNGVVSMLSEAAASVGIGFQRCLMPGGTCEASAFQAFGYKVGGLCVALGNYHNCAPDGTIGPEYVSVADAEAMAKLCEAVALGAPLEHARAHSLRDRLLQELGAVQQQTQTS